MKRLSLLLALGVGIPGQSPGQTRAPVGGLQLLEVRAEPKPPPFGEAFALHLTLRVPPAVLVFLPDTLVPSAAVQSVGRGTWVEPGPGDSLRIHATYPVIGFREGRVKLPAID